VFAELFETIEVGLNVWQLEDPDDPAGMRLRYANRASVAVTGLAVAAAVSRTLRDVLPEIAGGERPGIYAEVALGGDARVLGDIVYRVGDVDRTFSVRICGLPDCQVAVAFTDVTGEREADALVVHTLESMSDAFYTIDHESRCTYVNAAGERLFGHPREALLGSRWLDVFPEAEGSPLWAARQRAVREQVTVVAEAHFAPLGKWLSARFYPTPQGVAAYVQDVTERKQLEAQLLRSQKLEAVGQLVSGVAHDFNNVLTVIEGYTALSQARLDTDPPFVGGALKEIRNATGSAAALTAKLLAFSRRDPARTTSADLNTIVAAALALVAPLIGEDIIVHRALSPEPMTVNVDVTQIEQVIVNLAVNARDAMPDGGELSVTTAPVKLDADPSTGHGPQSCAQLIVTDTGFGIDEQTLAQIFDPFFTTKPVGKGTGLGLTRALGTVKAHGGTVEIQSAPGQGTCITIQLPCFQQERSEEPAAEAPAERAPAREALRILLVDDDQVILETMPALLESLGHGVETASRGEEALSRLAAGLQVDLVVLDHNMPGLTGTETLVRLREQRPELPVILASGFVDAFTENLVTSLPQVWILKKPYSLREIRRILAAVSTPGARV
jgi:hypothetical protein